MKKHNVLKESQKDWEKFSALIKWGSIGSAGFIAFILLFLY